MTRHERLNTLLDLLAERGEVEVGAAAVTLGVSAATVRRDMDALAGQQLLTRTRGGAVSHSVAYDLPIRYKSSRQAKEKQRIAVAASKLVNPGSVVGLSGGTTTTEIARVLAGRADLAAPGSQPRLTVVTNALNIANELAVRPSVKIVLTGGVAQSRSFELVGPYSELVLREITVDLAFIGANGIHAEIGATVHDESEARVNRLMAQRATSAMVVADSSKIGIRAFATIGYSDVFDGLITDSGAPAVACREFADRGLPVTVAGAES